jgi:hypothetical protein
MDENWGYPYFRKPLCLSDLVYSNAMQSNLIRIISNLWICSYGHTNTNVWAAGSRNENYQEKIMKGSSCHAQLGHAVGDMEGFKPS